jgi:6-phosphogluconolactonase
MSLAATTYADTPSAHEPAKFGKLWVFVGTYTEGKSKGIYRCELDPATGTLSAPGLAAATVSPSFLAVHPRDRFLYVGETDESAGKQTGTVPAGHQGSGIKVPRNFGIDRIREAMD